MYWLYPSGIYSTQVVRLFPKLQRKKRLHTTFTDIARFVSLEVLKQSLAGKKFTPADYERLIEEEFDRCAELEKSNGGLPLEATDIQMSSDISALPFPVVAPPGASARLEAYDTAGKLMTNVAPVGMEFKLDGPP
jgi:hypothetical protein